MADGQDPVTGADPRLHSVGEAALITHAEMHLGGNEHIAFTSSNCNPVKKSPNVLELKDENTSMGRKAIKSLGNMRNGPQSSHEIQEMV